MNGIKTKFNIHNKVIHVIVYFFIYLSLCFVAFADEDRTEKNQNFAALNFIAYMENQDITTDLEKWTDQKMIGELSKINLTDNDIKALYGEFKNTIVSPPDPDVYKEYSMINGEKVLESVIRLGRKMHNMLFAISDRDIEKYGNLLHTMRDALYIDSKSISFVIKHDNSRDSYWYDIYNKAVRNVDETYEATFSKK